MTPSPALYQETVSNPEKQCHCKVGITTQSNKIERGINFERGIDIDAKRYPTPLSADYGLYLKTCLGTGSTP